MMEYVSGGELMSLICKRGGFGEKRSRYVYQFKPTTLNTVACNIGAYFEQQAPHFEVIGRGLEETKTPRKGIKSRQNHRSILTQQVAAYAYYTLCAFGRHVGRCCDKWLSVVSSNLTIFRHTRCRDTWQLGGQTCATCCDQQCCDRLS